MLTRAAPLCTRATSVLSDMFANPAVFSLLIFGALREGRVQGHEQHHVASRPRNSKSLALAKHCCAGIMLTVVDIQAPNPYSPLISASHVLPSA
ncbi:hypothetical protein COCMIDRAFT_102939 [Bipolaris oryzae ATCC 44560]|uniref:Uncharacterized protein n=1 Tax=Bipolaris oryzae ATCC 44560 TaxID=930090 RepID=W6Z540_COCMI|nr:uncharacterized protein COCMIDRAFT_102939 [Bipolaris oryzae ATCC 44560]EUC42679.1 hypothetical protein COCMIDRAFT_102939 [Bipolaris oryzae ATCC 44560]